MRTVKLFSILLCLSGFVYSGQSVAVFPVQGVNIDKSFADAFGMLLANKYASVSNMKVINPLKSAAAVKDNDDLVAAAKKLGVDEYIEINAVGLYLSRREEKEALIDTSGGQRVIIINKEERSRDDQDLLDNGKTIVTVSRMDKDGNLIHKAELTLVTYGDIEESTVRFSRALWKKVSVEETRDMNNVTRREGMGHNKTFIETLKGVKIGMSYPTSFVREFSPLVSIGFNYKADAEKFFMEFGVGGKIPRDAFDANVRQYGGVFFEAGASYYVINNVVGMYLGGGIMPFIDFANSIQMGLEPYIQIGIMVPRNSRVCFYSELRFAQNALALMTGDEDYDDYYSYGLSREKDFPSEFGINFGIAF
ncbi:MAG: hypothetical protein GX089_13895 [Fibrobacter sp.]|jgi:hypothetical protein|nr:hypothetical protein [Fibrobacter sp.]